MRAAGSYHSDRCRPLYCTEVAVADLLCRSLSDACELDLHTSIFRLCLMRNYFFVIFTKALLVPQSDIGKVVENFLLFCLLAVICRRVRQIQEL